MRPSLTAAFGLLVLALAGCGSSDAPTEQRGPTRIANPYSDQLKALTPQNQRLTLLRAIRDNGKRCGRVEAGAYQEEYRNMALWVGQCEDGRYWGIFVAPTATPRCANAPRCASSSCPSAARSPASRARGRRADIRHSPRKRESRCLFNQRLIEERGTSAFAS